MTRILSLNSNRFGDEVMNLLVVDDEYMSRESLYEFFCQSEFNFDVVMKAKDGQQGMEIIKTYQPDILITDIVMPQKTGIELAEAVKSKYPDCEIIFLSGYSDKEYFKSAITLKAVRYIEKPISITELISAVKLSIALVREKEQTKTKIKSVDDYQFIQQIIHGNINDSLIKQYGTHRMGSFILFYESQNKNNQIVKVNNYKNYFESTTTQCYGARLTDNKYLVLVLYNDTKIVSILKDIIDKLEFSKPTARLLLSYYGDAFKGKDIYKKMAALESTIFFKGYQSLIIDPINNYEISGLFQTVEQKLDKAIDENDIFNLKLLARTLYNLAKEGSLGNKAMPIIDFYYRLFLKINKSKNSQIDTLLSQLNVDYFWEFISSIETLDELDKHFTRTIIDYCEFIEEKQSYSRKIIKAKEFIKQHFTDFNLTVVEVARAVEVTPEYLSQIFKRETTQTLNQYISYNRIELAKKLLIETELPFSSIAKKVGIHDASYLAKKFKNTVGVTPSDYRSKYEN